MKSLVITIAICASIVVGLGGCTRGISDDTPTASSISPTANSVGPTATRDPNSGPDFKEIRADILSIWRAAEAIPTPATPGSTQDYDKIDAQMNKLINRLKGKKVSAWQGWIVKVSEQKEDGPYWVTIDVDEIADRNPFMGFEYKGIRRTGLADVVLTGISPDNANKIPSGQKVMLNGIIKDLKGFKEDVLVTDPADGHLAVILADASLTDLKSDADKAKDVTITLTRPLCGMLSSHCYTYELTVHGDGKVLYREDDWDTIDDGSNSITLTSIISEGKVQQLVSEFEQMNYFSLQDDYNGYDVSDAPSATTSITIGTQRKSIFHYHGDTHAPKELTELEDKIEVALESAKPTATPALIDPQLLTTQP